MQPEPALLASSTCSFRPCQERPGSFASLCEAPLNHAPTLQASQALQGVQDAQATATAELTLQTHTLTQQLREADTELLKLQGEACTARVDRWDVCLHGSTQAACVHHPCQTQE